MSDEVGGPKVKVIDEDDGDEGEDRCAATLAICASWIVVYLAMAWQQGSLHLDRSNWLAGGVSISTTHLFGDMQSAEIFRGQVWRTVTATFVHYSIIHLALNVMGMYYLGRLVESWYGPWQFLAVYLAIGGLGNAISGMTRPLFGFPDTLHSGGGSTVVFGLIGLIGVYGYRKRTRFGDYVLGRMVTLMLLNGAMGLVLKNIDNFGHAGGAIVGAAIGFAHPALRRYSSRKAAKLVGISSIVVLLGCLAAQVRADRVESKNGLIEARDRRDAHATALAESVRRCERRAGAMAQALGFYREIHRRGLDPKPVFEPRNLLDGSRRTLSVNELSPEHLRQGLGSALAQLDEEEEASLLSGPNGRDYLRARVLAERALLRPPSVGEAHDFQTHLEPVLAGTLVELNRLKGQSDSTTKSGAAVKKN